MVASAVLHLGVIVAFARCGGTDPRPQPLELELVRLAGGGLGSGEGGGVDEAGGPAGDEGPEDTGAPDPGGLQAPAPAMADAAAGSGSEPVDDQAKAPAAPRPSVAPSAVPVAPDEAPAMPEEVVAATSPPLDHDLAAPVAQPPPAPAEEVLEVEDRAENDNGSAPNAVAAGTAPNDGASAASGTDTTIGIPAGDSAGGAGRGAGSSGGMGAGRSGVGGDGPGHGGSGDSITTLQSQLAWQIRSCYPAAARRRRTEGAVEIRFCTDAAGMPTELDLLRSSGSSLLDRAAAECVVRGSAPFALRERCITVPIEFRIR